MLVKEMTQEECIAVVSNGRMGNLACARDNRPYVVPIYYAFSENHLYSFSMPGQKIDWMRSNPRVCVQVDSFSDRDALAERRHARALPGIARHAGHRA